jgi:DNA-binding SARP family transcriptional activator
MRPSAREIAVMPHIRWVKLAVMEGDSARSGFLSPWSLGELRFLLLGPVEAKQGGTVLQLGRRRERCLLALLLLDVGKVVSAERLMDLLWDGAPPVSARDSLHSHVSRLRSVLDPGRDGARGIRLLVRNHGYLAEADPRQVDVHRFTELVGHARLRSDPDARAGMLRQALALWRGPVLAGSASDFLHRRVLASLTEQRLNALQLAIDAELERGRHRELVGELSALTVEYPEREQLWAQLALALYRCDRQAEALATLTRARSYLAGELGIDPGERLRRLYTQILDADPGLRPHARLVTTTHLLPMDIADFVGRERELSLLREIATQAGSTQVAVCAIEGMAGVGKTRLAIRAAHQFRNHGQFDEIQLWADLRGFHPNEPPVEPASLLDTFLRLLGVPPPLIPRTLEARAALYRDQLRRRRALIVLDNAADEDQVRPLLPGEPGCFVLITSRRSLVRLDGVHTLLLDVFSRDEAVELLRRYTGDERMTAEPDAARRVVDLCGNLPLAVALSARHLRTRPARTLGELVARLENDGTRVNPASPHAGAVRAMFELSYSSLSSPAKRLFRLLPQHPGKDFASASIAALAGLEVPETEAILDELTDEHLVQYTAINRYCMHDLVRQYAAVQGERHDTVPDRQAALERVTRHYLALAAEATLAVHPTETRRVKPPDAVEWATPAAAISSIEAEYENLLATVYRAADGAGDLPALALQVLAALYRPLTNRGHSDDQITLNRLAVRVAQRVGDRRAEAQAWEDLGTLSAQTNPGSDADTYSKRALAIWTELDDPTGQQACLAALGNSCRQRAQLDDAVAYLERSLAISHEIGYSAGAASALNYLGLTHQAAGRFDRAIHCLERSFSLYRDSGNRLGMAIALANRGWAGQRLGNPARAIADHRQSLATFHELGDYYNEAEQHWGLGQAYHAMGRTDLATEHWTAGITLLRDIRVLDREAATRLLLQDIPDTPAVIRLNT